MQGETLGGAADGGSDNREIQVPGAGARALSRRVRSSLQRAVVMRL